MIISASRRTDLPARYSEWLVNRFLEGFVYVRNPVNIHQVSRVSLSPEVVDGIVFWTKNPEPMLEHEHLDVFKNYAYYFQVTINAYGADIEPDVPSKKGVVIPAVQRFSDAIGPQRVIWRYDPILINDAHPKEYHYRYFEKMARLLSGYVCKCTFSFIDQYRHIEQNIHSLGIREITREDMLDIAQHFSEIADAYGLSLDTCAEAIDLEQFRIEHACCVDQSIFEELTGCRLTARKDPGQRKECGCMESIDIGMYNTCTNGCRYCYANFNQQTAQLAFAAHDPHSPVLSEKITDADKLTDRKMKSLKSGQGQPGQLSLFDL